MNKEQFIRKSKQFDSAGFEFHVNTWKQDGADGQIFLARQGSEFDGEVVDLFEDGAHEIYSQFKGQTPKFQFI